MPQESIVDEQENQKDENVHLRRFLRVLANFIILCCLGGSGYLIYYVVKQGQIYAQMNKDELTWFQKNEVGRSFVMFVMQNAQDALHVCELSLDNVSEILMLVLVSNLLGGVCDVSAGAGVSSSV